MYNPPTNTQLEAAAREYCRLSNMDADAPVRLQQPIVGANGPIDSLPRWRFLANSILDQSRLNEAMRVGFSDNPKIVQESETAQMLRNLEDLEARRPIKVD